MSYNIKFYCRQCKADKGGLAPVETSIIIDGKRTFLSLPNREYPADFKKAMESKRDNDIKRYCDAMRRNIFKAMTDIAEQGEALTIDSLKEYLKTGGVKKYTVEDMFNDFLSFQQEKIGSLCAQQQYRKYEIVRDVFYGFTDKTKPATSINGALVESFVAILNKTYAASTVSSMTTKFKAVVEFAIRGGKIKTNPFLRVRIEKQKPKIEYLTDEELDKVRNVELDTDCLKNVRNLFLFQCASGISYGDMAKLDKCDITEENGVYYVSKTRCKTGVPFTSVILPEGVQILKDCDFKLRVLSNQKYNLFLQQIQALAGVKTKLHSHLGRKVYGCSLLKAGCNMKTVSRALGHSNTQITQSTYAFLMEKDIVKEISSKFAQSK